MPEDAPAGHPATKPLPLVEDQQWRASVTCRTAATPASAPPFGQSDEVVDGVPQERSQDLGNDPTCPTMHKQGEPMGRRKAPGRQATSRDALRHNRSAPGKPVRVHHARLHRQRNTRIHHGRIDRRRSARIHHGRVDRRRNARGARQLEHDPQKACGRST